MPVPLQASCGESNMLDEASESDINHGEAEEIDDPLRQQKIELK